MEYFGRIQSSIQKKTEEKEGTKFLAENAEAKEMPLAGDGEQVWKQKN